MYRPCCEFRFVCLFVVAVVVVGVNTPGYMDDLGRVLGQVEGRDVGSVDVIA